MSPTGLEAARLHMGGREVVVFVVPRDGVEPSAGDLLASLSPAERAVVMLLLEGWTNAEIAGQRGTTLRTVSKQIEAAYRRLGVHSRGELAARIGRRIESP